MEILKQMNKEYNSIENQLDKVVKALRTMNSDTEILDHEIMELSTEIENLGLSINELEEHICKS